MENSTPTKPQTLEIDPLFWVLVTTIVGHRFLARLATDAEATDCETRSSLTMANSLVLMEAYLLKDEPILTMEGGKPVIRRFPSLLTYSLTNKPHPVMVCCVELVPLSLLDKQDQQVYVSMLQQLKARLT